MARHRRTTTGGVVYHVCNRGSRKGPLFRSTEDYLAFVRLLSEARDMRPMRIIAYCLMPNHWHILLWPQQDGALSKYMHWLTGTHASRWRLETGTRGQGAVYQSRYTAVVVRDLRQLLTVWRYVERNPIEAGLVTDAEDWPWSSAATCNADSPDLSLDEAPISRPQEWLSLVNQRGLDVAALVEEDATLISEADSWFV